MEFAQRVEIPVGIDETWALLTDLIALSRCVPGVDGVSEQADGSYAGTLQVRLGPVGVRLEGSVAVAEADNAEHRMELRVTATDRKIGGTVNATTRLRLEPVDTHLTTLRIDTDARILGRLGDFGQPVIKRKADQIVGSFAACVAMRLAADRPATDGREAHHA